MNAPAPTVDPLEFARGAFCAATFVAINKAREVHISSLVDSFNRAGVATTDTLKTLWFLRETQSLDGGYWIPAPARSVHLANGLCILSAVQPTDELRRHFPGVQRAGSARIAPSDMVARLPGQSLKSWRGADGLPALDWTKSTIEDVCDKLSPSLGEDEFELWGARARPGKSNGWEPAWLRFGEGRGYEWRGIGLFRTRTGKATHRHFLGRRRDKAAFLEGPSVHDVARMKFGLAALDGLPLHLSVTAERDAVTIRLPMSAPTALRRLLVALCDEELGSFGRSWTCHLPQCLPVLTDALNELSGEVIERE